MIRSPFSSLSLCRQTSRLSCARAASLFPCIHQCEGTPRFIVSVTPLLFLTFVSDSILLRAPFDPRRAVLLSFFLVHPTISLFLVNRRFIPSAQGRLKTSQALSMFLNCNAPQQAGETRGRGRIDKKLYLLLF